MPKSRTIPGIHIQWPWSQLILSGKKSIETRSYPIPDKYLGKPLAIIETPGPRGKREGNVTQARIVGLVIFDSCYKYNTKSHWIKESDKHLVHESDALFSFNKEKEKWAWNIKEVSKLPKPAAPPAKRGITFVNNCEI